MNKFCLLHIKILKLMKFLSVERKKGNKYQVFLGVFFFASLK